MIESFSEFMLLYFQIKAVGTAVVDLQKVILTSEKRPAHEILTAGEKLRELLNRKVNLIKKKTSVNIGRAEMQVGVLKA